MPTELILMGIPVSLIPGVVGTPTGTTFALPANTTSVGWQTSYDVAPAAIDIDLQIAMDSTGPWTVLDTSTDVNGEFRIVSSFMPARFVRALVNTNTGNRVITVQLILKKSAF
jgi:hypothetical protein